MTVDWTGRRACLAFEMNVERKTHKFGILELDGLFFLATEAPTAPTSEWLGRPLRITAEGSFPNAAIKTSLELPGDLPSDAIGHYFYASNTNGFTVFAATTIGFLWCEGT
ncbi:MAG: hypothetical protein SF187_29855 [Deltaproteobacteria bacterium]|nr:hypothetical protein [Deltaproteobacteria bacterium]